MLTARTLIYPSPNGTAALVHREEGGIRLVDLPGGTVRVERGTADVLSFALSAGGTAFAVLTTHAILEVHRNGALSTYPLPESIAGSHTLAISDAGDRLGITRPTSATTGRIEVWSLPTGAGPIASADLPMPQAVATAADATLSILTVRSPTVRGKGYFGAYTRAPVGDALDELWTEDGLPPPRVPLGVFGGWTWVSEAESILGRRRGEEPVHLAGTLRDRIIVSPDGAHLLAWRTERMIGAVDGEVLFRLFDTASWSEIGRVSHVVNHVATTQFVLSSDGTLWALSPSASSWMEVRQLSWEGTGPVD